MVVKRSFMILSSWKHRAGENRRAPSPQQDLQSILLLHTKSCGERLRWGWGSVRGARERADPARGRLTRTRASMHSFQSMPIHALMHPLQIMRIHALMHPLQSMPIHASMHPFRSTHLWGFSAGRLVGGIRTLWGGIMKRWRDL